MKTTEQFIEFVAENILSGGKRTTAEKERAVFNEIALHADAILSLLEVALVQYEDEGGIGTEKGTHLIIPGFNSLTPEETSLFKIMHTQSGTILNFWIDANGITRLNVREPDTGNEEDGSFIQPRGTVRIEASAILEVGYVDLVELTGSGNIAQMTRHILDTEDAKFPESYEITFIFTSDVTIKHNQGGDSTILAFLLKGSVDFVGHANDTLTVKYFNDKWREISRSTAL